MTNNKLLNKISQCTTWEAILQELISYDKAIVVSVLNILGEYMGKVLQYSDGPSYINYNGSRIEGWEYCLSVDGKVVASIQEG